MNTSITKPDPSTTSIKDLGWILLRRTVLQIQLKTISIISSKILK